MTSLSIASDPALRMRGELRVPSDKSVTQRALLFSLLARGTSTLERPLDAGDTRAVRKALIRLGAQLDERPGEWRITGARPVRVEGHGPLDLENSGTGARLLCGLLVGQRVTAEITGDLSLRRRPMARVVRPLAAMGARFSGPDPEHLPLRVEADPPLRPFVGRLDVASAQVKSAVLLAALGAEGWTRLREPAPTRAHTEAWLPRFGVELSSVLQGTIELRGPQTLEAAHVRIPADPSAAAFHAAAAALLPGSRIELTEVLLSPRRTAFFDVLARMGARVERQIRDADPMEPVGVIAVAHQSLRGTEITRAEVPDLIDELPLIAVLGACAQGETLVHGAAELRVKESDRLVAMEEGLRRMGASIELFDDGFRVQGSTPLRGAPVRSHADHRIAMALAVAGLRARGTTTIDDFDCAAISYPGFCEDLAQLLGTRRFLTD